MEGTQTGAAKIGGARACDLRILVVSSISNEKSLLDYKLDGERWLERIDDMVRLLF